MKISDKGLIENVAQFRPDEIADMARELVAARRLIDRFESMLVGCVRQSFAGYENGNGRDVGTGIEAARRKYHKFD